MANRWNRRWSGRWDDMTNGLTNEQFQQLVRRLSVTRATVLPVIPVAARVSARRGHHVAALGPRIDARSELARRIAQRQLLVVPEVEVQPSTACLHRRRGGQLHQCL